MESDLRDKTAVFYESFKLNYNFNLHSYMYNQRRNGYRDLTTFGNFPKCTKMKRTSKRFIITLYKKLTLKCVQFYTIFFNLVLFELARHRCARIKIISFITNRKLRKFDIILFPLHLNTIFPNDSRIEKYDLFYLKTISPFKVWSQIKTFVFILFKNL